jgi:hypothetical protein
LQEQAPDESENKKAGTSGPGFFFVAECGEISNLRLVVDIRKILEFSFLFSKKTILSLK